MIESFQKLVILRTSQVVSSSKTGVMDFFFDTEGRKQIMLEADEWARRAIAVVRSARDPNPWREASDETIAAEIVRQAEQAMAERKTSAGDHPEALDNARKEG